MMINNCVFENLHSHARYCNNMNINSSIWNVSVSVECFQCDSEQFTAFSSRGIICNIKARWNGDDTGLRSRPLGKMSFRSYFPVIGSFSEFYLQSAKASFWAWGHLHPWSFYSVTLSYFSSMVLNPDIRKICDFSLCPLRLPFLIAGRQPTIVSRAMSFFLLGIFPRSVMQCLSSNLSGARYYEFLKSARKRAKQSCAYRGGCSLCSARKRDRVVIYV